VCTKTRPIFRFFYSDSQSVGSYDKRKYELSKETDRLTLFSSMVNSEKERVEIARSRAWNAQQPIHELPDEVLCEIFLLSVSPINSCLWKAPFLTTCHHWRKCAVCCPQLWSIVSIVYRTELDELGVWLSRSASAPLHIRFCYIANDGSSEKIMAHFTAAYEAVSNHSCRLHSIPT
jgi:hypothetical protein